MVSCEFLPESIGQPSSELTFPELTWITFQTSRRLSITSWGETSSSWGPERGCCQDWEHLESAGGILPGIFQDGLPIRLLQAMSEVLD